MKSTALLETRADELSRLVAAKATKQIVLRRGRKLGVYVGCGYPKSGTVWLCQLLSTAIGVPYPREYRSPIAMSSVVHAHWRYAARMPPTAYIYRDGRDVMVSLYFFYIRAFNLPAKPKLSAGVRARFQHLYGPGFDPSAVRENLPKFIESEATSPRSTDGLAWHQHIQDWWDRPQVSYLSYEELRADTPGTLMRVLKGLGVDVDDHITSLAADRWSFETTSGRAAGNEDRTSFQRKGIVGDWMNHFSREAGEVFDAIAGDALVSVGYAEDRDWFRKL
jgi:hypothetical protein